MFRAGVDVRCLCYYILFYLILYLLFLSPPLLPIPIYHSSPSHSFPSLPLSSSFKVYVSVFGYPYLYYLLIFPIILSQISTPHVLSEWMVEVCGAYLCGVGLCFVLVLTYGVRLFCFVLMVTLGVILYITIIYYILYIIYYILDYTYIIIIYYILYIILYYTLLF